LSGTKTPSKWIFIPIIDGITYEFNINNNNDINSIKINSQELQLVDSKKEELYYDNRNNEIKKINNVFVLFGTIATSHNYKIKIELTLNPCDYIRGFIFSVNTSDLSKLANIFENYTELNVSNKSFAILNRENKLNIPSTITIYVAKCDATVCINTNETEIKNVNSGVIKIKGNDVSQDLLRIFRYSTQKV